MAFVSGSLIDSLWGPINDNVEASFSKTQFSDIPRERLAAMSGALSAGMSAGAGVRAAQIDSDGRVRVAQLAYRQPTLGERIRDLLPGMTTALGGIGGNTSQQRMAGQLLSGLQSGQSGSGYLGDLSSQLAQYRNIRDELDYWSGTSRRTSQSAIGGLG